MTSAYDVIGVDSNADEATINAAFRKAAKKCHPDLNNGDTTREEYLRRLLSARAGLKRRSSRSSSSREHRRLIVRNPWKGRKIVAVGTFAAATAMLALLVVSHRAAPPPISAFETRTIYLKPSNLSGVNSRWTTGLRDLSEQPLPRQLVLEGSTH
jgi:hypothetical protein